jgi:hypothetical protein
MRISRHDHLLTLNDGHGARYGLGAIVPALVIGVGLAFGWPSPDGRVRIDLGTLLFLVTAVVIVVLRAPRIAAFDRQRGEVRLVIGWPPLAGRRRTIGFDDIDQAKVRRLIKLGPFGSARPVLALRPGSPAAERKRNARQSIDLS